MLGTAFPYLCKMRKRSMYSILFSFFFLSLLTAGLYKTGTEISMDEIKRSEGQHPGYFEQWKKEKQNKDGIIPKWKRNEWIKWDNQNQQVRKRNESPIFDTIIEIGPKAIGGRTRGLWVDPENDNHLLAAGISGGMWKSKDQGQSWEPINEHEVSMMPSCITSNPFNPDIIYYGTGESRANSADVSGNGVFKSIDRGESFEQLNSTVGLNGMDEIWDIEHSKSDSSTLFVGTNSRGLYRSTDEGSTWENVYSGGNRQVNDILCLPNNRILISMHANGVLMSDSNGNAGTWTTASFPNRPGSGQFRRIQLANCAAYPNVVYALFEGYGFSDPPSAFYKSSDGGRSWTKLSTPTTIGAGYQRYCVMLGVSNHDSDFVAAGGVRSAYSTNGGKNWTRISGTHADHHSFISFNQNPNDYALGTDGGVYKLRWGSSSVTGNLNNGYKVTQFYAGGPGFEGYDCLGGTQDNGTHYAKAPMVAQYIFGGDGAYSHIGQQDGSVAYLSTQNDGIRRVDNFKTGPRKFTSIKASEFTSDGVAFINAYNMNEKDQYMLFYRTNRNIYRTVDGGESWEKINLNIKGGMKAIGISNDENPVLYYGGNGAQLYKLEDAATATETEVSYNLTVPREITTDYLNFIEVNPNNKYQIFCAFSNYSDTSRIWKVSNLDTDDPEWVDISANLPKGLPVNSVAVDPWSPEHYIFAATDFGLYYTLDGGVTWEKEMSVPSVAIHEVKIRNSDRTLFAFTHGRGIWYMELKDVRTETAQPEITNHAVIYPNPNSGDFSIKTTLSVRGYDIVDSKGQVVKAESFRNPTKIISIKDLAKGMYFIQLHGERGVSTEKIIVR